MSIRKLPYKKIEPLIKKYLNNKENEKTKKLIDELRKVKNIGFLTKSELEKICKWKSPRAINLIRKNSESKIIHRTRNAFATKIERKKIYLLTSLKGVSIPMASSVLMLINPKRYGVIDKRVWELLFNIGIVKNNSKGINFDFNQWYRYLIIGRSLSRKFNVKVRDIERTLFLIHKKYQSGNLY